MSESAYVSSDKINKQSLRVSGVASNTQSHKINRVVYGNNISTNRIRDERK